MNANQIPLPPFIYLYNLHNYGSILHKQS
uniref:Uncharacterized protein n=1 Tax=Anguilla anguilla TaxID=7936 RepID=A0A0E9QRF5_ANGAN